MDRRTRIEEILWLLATTVLLLPLITDRVSGWFLRGFAGIAGLLG